MSVALALLSAAAVLLLALRFALGASPEKVARALRLAGPAAVIAAGGLATLLGRAAVGVPLVGFGLAWLGRARATNRSRAAEAAPDRRSTVRSRALEMSLDHGTGAMDGRVLSGAFHGSLLSELDEAALRSLRAEIDGDADSLRLLEAYLDRRAPGWRADAQAEVGGGLGRTPGPSPMSEQEAYEVLGLEPGATLADIREAHRRLMKRVHPDHGGTHRLAARVNEAKAVLVDRHV
jgi:DnaJ-domain-containing protein 1